MRVAATSVTCSALLVVIGLQAQTTETFEVASIRRNLTGNQQGGGLAGPQPGGRFIAIGAPLRRLIVDAYGVQVIGGPAWIDTDRFCECPRRWRPHSRGYQANAPTFTGGTVQADRAF